MKKIRLYLLLIALSVNCLSCETFQKQAISGEYINFEAGLISKINFKSTHAHFHYVFVEMSGPYTVSDGYVYIEAGGELGTLALKIVSENELQGDGWAAGRYLRKSYLNSKAYGLVGRYRTKGRLNLRESPSRMGKVLLTLEKGTKVEVIEVTSRDWSKISVEGSQGYVSTKYLEKIK